MGQDAPIRVMVVDDHPMWRDAVARDLTEAGCEVVATAAFHLAAQRLQAAQDPTPRSVLVQKRLRVYVRVEPPLCADNRACQIVRVAVGVMEP